MHDALTEFDLVDIWRTFNPDGRRYTWRRKTPEIHCRLDFFLVSQSVAMITQTIDMENQYLKYSPLRKLLKGKVEHQTKGAILRSKIVWYNEGGKNTKYFLDLEKRHFKQGTVSQLKTVTRSLFSLIRKF